MDDRTRKPGAVFTKDEMYPADPRIASYTRMDNLLMELDISPTLALKILGDHYAVRATGFLVGANAEFNHRMSSRLWQESDAIARGE